MLPTIYYPPLLPTSPGASLWTSQMPSTVSAGRPCSWRSTDIFPPWQLGWSRVTLASPYSIWAMTHFAAVVGYKKGPLGFALTLQPLIEKLKASVAGLGLNVWYLDDGTLMGSPGDLAAALQILERDGPPLGLHLNRGKPLLFIPEDADADQSPLPPDIPITRRGFSLLGCPVGPPDYCEEIFQARIEKVKVSLGALQDLEDAQLEYTLLRSCLSLPKVSFLLRACPPSHILNAAKDFDCHAQST